MKDYTGTFYSDATTKKQTHFAWLLSFDSFNLSTCPVSGYLPYITDIGEITQVINSEQSASFSDFTVTIADTFKTLLGAYSTSILAGKTVTLKLAFLNDDSTVHSTLDFFKGKISHPVEFDEGEHSFKLGIVSFLSEDKQILKPYPVIPASNHTFLNDGEWPFVVGGGIAKITVPLSQSEPPLSATETVEYPAPPGAFGGLVTRDGKTGYWVEEYRTQEYPVYQITTLPTPDLGRGTTPWSATQTSRHVTFVEVAPVTKTSSTAANVKTHWLVNRYPNGNGIFRHRIVKNNFLYTIYEINPATVYHFNGYNYTLTDYSVPSTSVAGSNDIGPFFSWAGNKFTGELIEDVLDFAWPELDFNYDDYEGIDQRGLTTKTGVSVKRTISQIALEGGGALLESFGVLKLVQLVGTAETVDPVFTFNATNTIQRSLKLSLTSDTDVVTSFKFKSVASGAFGIETSIQGYTGSVWVFENNIDKFGGPVFLEYQMITGFDIDVSPQIDCPPEFGGVVPT